MGSWIGGDRDGNPFVDAEVLRAALERQARLAFAHYLEQIHLLGGELPIAARLVSITPELAGARRRLRRRFAVPPGRTLPPGAGRAFMRGWRRRARALCGYVPPREPHASGEPYRSSAELRAALDIIARSLANHGSAALAERRLRSADARGGGVRIPSRRRSTCARTPRCTSASWPNCCGLQAYTAITRRSPRPSAWPCSARELAGAQAAVFAPSGVQRDGGRASSRSCKRRRTSTAASARPRFRTTLSRTASR